MKNVKNSGKFFSSAVTAVCMFSNLSTSYSFDETTWQTLPLAVPEAALSICPSPAICTPFCVLVPAVIWPLGKMSLLIWLKTNYF